MAMAGGADSDAGGEVEEGITVDVFDNSAVSTLGDERIVAGARGYWLFSFAFPADAAVPTIFENYTTIGEFLTDAIGGSEVAAFAGGLAVRDQLFDICVAEGAFVGIAELVEFGYVIVF